MFIVEVKGHWGSTESKIWNLSTQYLRNGILDKSHTWYMWISWQMQYVKKGILKESHINYVDTPYLLWEAYCLWERWKFILCQKCLINVNTILQEWNLFHVNETEKTSVHALWSMISLEGNLQIADSYENVCNYIIETSMQICAFVVQWIWRYWCKSNGDEFQFLFESTSGVGVGYMGYRFYVFFCNWGIRLDAFLWK